jgi:hypothetical protein
MQANWQTHVEMSLWAQGSATGFFAISDVWGIEAVINVLVQREMAYGILYDPR